MVLFKLPAGNNYIHVKKARTPSEIEARDLELASLEEAWDVGKAKWAALRVKRGWSVISTVDIESPAIEAEREAFNNICALRHRYLDLLKPKWEWKELEE